MVLFVICVPPVVWAQPAHSCQGTQFMRQERAGERGRSAHCPVAYPEPAEHKGKTKRGKRQEEGASGYSAAKPRLEHKLTAWTISHEGQYTGRRSCKLQESVLQKLLSSGSASWFSIEPSLSEKREAIQIRVPGPLNGAPHWLIFCNESRLHKM